MKVSNVLKNVVLGILVTMMVGCAGVGGTARLTVDSHRDGGVVYGKATTFTGNNKSRMDEVCDAINNSDARCLEKEKYQARFVVSSMEYWGGAQGFVAVADKDMDVGNEWRGGDGVFVKASREAGKLGTILEVVSRPGDNNCHWSGMPGVGGTVCPAYNWDYRQDNQAAISSK